MSSLGWKDVLRPIRDRLRDVIPPGFRDPPPEPSPEERRRRRCADTIRGFAYLETFEELAAWSADSVDPLQRSNTPLLPRDLSHLNEEPLGQGKAKLLLVHDYAGGYHEYEAAQETAVETEQYTCERLQFVEAFVYFSHKLVTVPPPSWVNLLHRSGVPVLGTFIVERQTTGAEAILERETVVRNERDDEIRRQSEDVEIVDLRFPVAEKLAQIAECYGFDGWLINIEKSFHKDSWNLSSLLGFLEEVKCRMGKKKRIIWYDALTVDNEVSYQNGLTYKNLAFAEAAGAILTNYKWDLRAAGVSEQLALQHHIPKDNIYFGVDLWAQNSHNGGPHRITYPAKGGGGTNTGVAVAKLAELGFSAGLFGPAWPFEHCQQHAIEVDRSVWDGDVLPSILNCGCGDDNPHHTPLYERNPIFRKAVEFPMSSSLFFDTKFIRAIRPYSAFHGDLGQDNHVRSHLSAQSPLPHLLSLKSLQQIEPPESGILFGRLLRNAASFGISVSVAPPLRPTAQNRVTTKRLRLFPLNMEGNFIVTICFSKIKLPAGNQMSVFVGFKLHTLLLPLVEHPDSTFMQSFKVSTLEKPGWGSIREIGVAAVGIPFKEEDAGPIFNVMGITITPTDIAPGKGSERVSIQDLNVKHYEDGDERHWRLHWSLGGQSTWRKSDSLPYSRTTGPLAYFRVEIMDVQTNRAWKAIAYCCEMILPDDILADYASNGFLVVLVKGIMLYDRGNVASERVRLEIVR